MTQLEETTCEAYRAKSLHPEVAHIISGNIALSWISLVAWNLFPFQVILVLGKARSPKAPNVDCRGAEWVTWVIWCFAKKLCMRHDAWVGTSSRWSCQSLVAHSCSLLNHPNGFCGGMFKLNAKFDADSLPYSLSHFECGMATQYTCLLTGIYCSPLTSTVKSSLFTHVHSRPLSLAAINVLQTVLIILTMAGLFPDRPRILFKLFECFSDAFL